MNKTLFLVLFFAQSLYAGDVYITEWLVKRKTLIAGDQARILSSGRGSSNGQPILNTMLLQPSNTDYFLLRVSTITASENAFLLGLEATGTIVKQATYIIRTTPDFRTGQPVTEMADKIIYRPSPNDFNRSWLDFTINRST